MAAVVTTPATGLDLGIARGLTALEVRSGPMILTVHEISDGGLIVVATPAAGFAGTGSISTERAFGQRDGGAA
jgi:hypothetical protein